MKLGQGVAFFLLREDNYMYATADHCLKIYMYMYLDLKHLCNYEGVMSCFLLLSMTWSKKYVA